MSLESIGLSTTCACSNCTGWRVFLTRFVGGSHQWSAGCVNEAHLIPNFLPVGKLLWSDVFLHLKPKRTFHSVRSCTKCAFFFCSNGNPPWGVMFLPLGGVWWVACTDPALDSPLLPLAALQHHHSNVLRTCFTQKGFQVCLVCVTGECTHQLGCWVSVGQSPPVPAWWTSWWAQWVWPF